MVRAMSALPSKADIFCGERNDAEHDFSHPISHRTPQYRVGNHGIGRFVIGQKCSYFRDKRHRTTQSNMDRNGLGNRCSIRLSYGTIHLNCKQFCVLARCSKRDCYRICYRSSLFCSFDEFYSRLERSVEPGG
jgi:hypothetical protein